MSEITIERLEREGVPFLRVVGEVDAYYSSALRDALEPLMKEGHAEIGIDLGGVDFIDSAGVMVLLNTRRRLQREDRRLRLTNLSPRVQRVFDILKLSPGSVRPRPLSARASRGPAFQGSR